MTRKHSFHLCLSWSLYWNKALLQWCAKGAISIAVLLAFLPALHAQVTATINGTVTDKVGSVIPNASAQLASLGNP